MIHRIVAILGIVVFSLAATNSINAQGRIRPDLPQNPPNAEGNIHGTWVGYYVVVGSKVKITCSIRADGTYKTVAEYASNVTVEIGKYTYADGVLSTEPEGGFIGVYNVTFENRDTMKAVGRGLSITYKRQ